MIEIKEWETEAGLRARIREQTLGFLCGYVCVPEGHPWHEKDYSTALCGHDGCYNHTLGRCIEVHGGVTYAGDLGGGGWWLGFDCGHGGDLVPGLRRFHGEVYRDEKYVTEQCEKMARQLADVEASND